MNVNETLAEREKTHGDFKAQARTAQKLKGVMHQSENWLELSAWQQIALDMIAVKISRVLHGDPNHHDSWHDISGYSTLVLRQLEICDKPEA